jgi:tetratricopeptide (TPR) repeat protein
MQMVTQKTEPKASFEANTLAEYTGPLHRKLIRYFNDYHEAVEEGDREAMQELDEVVPPLLKKFGESEVQSSPNPSWLKAKMWAGWHVARGEYEQALAFEQEGWEHAQAEIERPETREAVAKRQSVSASNIADELRRIGKHEEALKWALLSVELWSSNPINHLVLALAMYRGGYHDKAERIIEELLRMADFRSGRDILANCMKYERELYEMDNLRAVQALLKNTAMIEEV